MADRANGWKRQVLRTALFGLASLLVLQAPPSFAGSAPPSNPYANPPSTENIEGSLSVDEKKLIQEGLIWAGVYNGWMDGSFGKGTRDAIAAIQRQYQQPATGQLDPDLAMHLGGSALNAREKSGWKTITDPTTGVTLGYPAKVLTVINKSTDGSATVDLDSSDKSISLELVLAANAQPGQIDTLYNNLTGDGQSTVTYQLRKDNLFIAAGDRGTNKFYSRYEQRGNQIRGYDLVWRKDRDEDMQAISVLISNSFEPFDTPHQTPDPDYSHLAALAQAAKRDPGNNAPAQNPGPAPAQQPAPARQPQANTTPQDDPSEGKGTRFSYTYEAPTDAKLEDAYRFTRKADLLVGNVEIDAMDGMFVMPRPLHYVATQCGVVNAFYSPKDSAIFLCYEMVDYLLRQAEQLNTDHDPAFLLEYVKDNLRFILLHETGHAFIDMLNLPATGREEDAVDQMAATMILLHVADEETPEQLTRVLSLTATWFKTNASLENGNADTSAFSDEHSLNEQRYYNLLCMVYGRDPDYYAAIVENGLLPKARAARCPQEANKIISAWSRLLLPHFAPRYQQVAQETLKRLDEQDAARAQNPGQGNTQ